MTATRHRRPRPSPRERRAERRERSRRPHRGDVHGPAPGDRFLQASFDGQEPFDEVGAFRGVSDWRDLDAAFLDEHSAAPAFLSEAGLRFFLLADLLADLAGRLGTADPLFGLIHGFSEMHVEVHADGVVHRSGGHVLLGARHFGAITWEDAMRHRLSVFCRQEASVICGFLRHRRDRDSPGTERARIQAALERFREPRAASAPTRADLDGGAGRRDLTPP